MKKIDKIRLVWYNIDVVKKKAPKFAKYERIIKMKNYQVKFKGFSAFTDTVIVYDVASRQEAIQVVKEHYGSSVKIISAKMIKD